MRKRALAFVLPLLMLLAQHGALWHEIGHLGGGARTEKQHPADRLCDSCLAFAHLAAAAKPEIPALPQPASGHAVAAAAAVAFLAADAPSRRSRGPPRFL